MNLFRKFVAMGLHIVPLLFVAQHAVCQNALRVAVVDVRTKEALVGVNVYIRTLGRGGATDTTGQLVVKNLPNGTFAVEFSLLGFRQQQLELSFPLPAPQKVITVQLEPTVLETEGITVTTTRTNSRIEDVPVRVEVLGLEEVNEEIAIRPANISKLLGETTGILVQQTSAISGNVSFRIQGLPGQYTQLLKDGFPLYGGFSSGLSLLQIPPLDLRQVEVIKGSSSTLYGGGAIAGIVNLVSKSPSDRPEWDLLLNQTQKGGRDLAAFYSGKSDKLGMTFLASGSTQRPIDVNGDGFSDLPELKQLTLFPKLFLPLGDAGTLTFGISSSLEDRKGGDMVAVGSAPDSAHPFIEENKSSRITSQLKFEKRSSVANLLTFKNSVNYFRRTISGDQSSFGGEQVSTYSELSYLWKLDRHSVVAGLDFISDSFNEDKALTKTRLDYHNDTFGAFLQDEWKLSGSLMVQTGLRIDRHSKYGIFVLPYLASLYRISDNLYVRASGGLGYQAPTVFTDEPDKAGYAHALPIGDLVKAETSEGLNLDINYSGVLSDEVKFSINQAFYYTRLNNPLFPQSDSLAKHVLFYANAAGQLEGRGFDTDIMVTLDEMMLSIDYTYTDALKKVDGDISPLELTPRHKVNMTLSYEVEKSWRTGIEAFYTGRQYRDDGSRTRDYWMIGFMIEKLFTNFSVIGNVENIFDVRQTRFENIVIPPYTKPTFRQIYAPLDGIVANVAVRIQL